MYWCPNCNIPTTEPVCPKCKGSTVRIPLSDPGDARLAFERDYKNFEKAVEFELGATAPVKELLGHSPMLLNKAPYYDEMKEVFVDGVQIGRLYFDPFLLRWRFRFSKVGILRIIDRYWDLVPKVVADKKRYHHLDLVDTGGKSFDKYKQVILINSAGEPVGVAYSRGGGKLIVHSWWGSDKVDNVGYSTNSTLDDVVRAHRDVLRVLESKSKKIIAIYREKVGTDKPVIVSFSGGKDSLVTLQLTMDLGIEPIILFNNTGIELPETVETVHKTVDRYGLKLVEASAGDIFWKAVYFFGPPGRDYRWCCKICKLAPLTRATKEYWSSGGLNVTGIRAFESLDRARSPIAWRLRWSPYLLNISPVLYWSQFEGWLYIFDRKLPINPLYNMGYERIGCFMCPASTMAELTLVAETHRELWEKWLEVLRYWAQKLNKPPEWIQYGLWRWNAPARYRTAMAKRLRIVESIDNWKETFYRMSHIIDSITVDTDIIKIRFSNAINSYFLYDQIKVLSPKGLKRTEEDGKLVVYWDEAEIHVGENTLASHIKKPEGVEKLIDVLKAFYRWKFCVGCRSCELNCPTGAFKVEEIGGIRRPRVVHPEKCISCKMCLYNCPIAEVYVEHVVSPLIVDNPEAWRRSTREHHEIVMRKVVEIMKKMKPELFESKPVSRPEDVDIGAFIASIEGGSQT